MHNLGLPPRLAGSIISTNFERPSKSPPSHTGQFSAVTYRSCCALLLLLAAFCGIASCAGTSDEKRYPLPGIDDVGANPKPFDLMARLDSYGTPHGRYFSGKAFAVDGRTVLINGELVHFWQVLAPNIHVWPHGPWGRILLQRDLRGGIECVEIERNGRGEALAVCSNAFGILPRWPLATDIATFREPIPNDVHPIMREVVQHYGEIDGNPDIAAQYRAENVSPPSKRIFTFDEWQNQDDGVSRYPRSAFDLRTEYEGHQVSENVMFEGPATVVDGATLMIDGQLIKLLGVAAPEMQLRPWGPDAKEALTKEVGESIVRCLEIHVDREGASRAICESERSGLLPAYGLISGRVVLDKAQTVSLEKADLGRHFTTILLLETLARAADRGIWHNELTQ